MADLDSLLRGSIDMHLHHGPDPAIARRVDALQAATQAQQAGMRAIVLKSHSYPTAPLAIIVGQMVPGLKVWGALSLDHDIGGLNHHALEVSARLGAKVVWMPTHSSPNSRMKIPGPAGKSAPGISLLDKKGELVPEVSRILALVKEYGMVLATGHVSPAETFALVAAARDMDIWKIVITHAEDTQIVEHPLTVEDQQRLARMGAFIEYTVNGLLPTSRRYDPARIAEGIKTIGAQHFIISSDLGQIQNPPPVEGMRLFMAVLLQQGMTGDDIELMAKTNPARLLGLDEAV